MTEEKAIAEVEAKAREAAQEWAGEAAALVVTDDLGLTNAANVLGELASQKKNLEKQRQFFVGPLNDQVRRINDLFRQLVEPYDRARSTIETKVLAYRRAKEAEVAKERARLAEIARQEAAALAEQAKNSTPEQPTLALEPAPPAKPIEQPKTVSGMTARKIWKWEVQNFAEVPREYLQLDERSIGDAVRLGTRSIPGVRIFEEEIIAVRGR